MSIRVYSDGSHNGAATITKGAIVIYDGDVKVAEETALGGAGWSDVAEYVAVRLGLQMLIALGFIELSIIWFNDSQFVMKQMAGLYKIRDKKGYSLLARECQQLLKQFKNIKFHWISRELNKEADKLSKL